MEVKVTCPCGTRYEFEVEPEHERMPWAVSCPECGADGTELANEAIQQSLAEAADTADPAYTPPQPTPAPIGGLRINRPAQEDEPPPPPAFTAPSLVVVRPSRQSA